LGLFFRFFGVVHYIYYAASDGEDELLIVVGLKGDSHGSALPNWRRTLGVGIVGSRGFACVFFQDQLATSYLSDDRVQFLAVIGPPAVR